MLSHSLLFFHLIFEYLIIHLKVLPLKKNAAIHTVEWTQEEEQKAENRNKLMLRLQVIS